MAIATKPHEIIHEELDEVTVAVTVKLGEQSASFTIGGIDASSFIVYENSRIEFRTGTGEDRKRVWLSVTVPTPEFF